MLGRMRAEKESAEAFVDNEICPVCHDNFNVDSVVTPCSHIFCRTCIVEHIRNTYPVDHTAGEIRYKANERPCPICRGSLSEDKLFNRTAFEPTEHELNNELVNDINVIDIYEKEAPEKRITILNDALMDMPCFVPGPSTKMKFMMRDLIKLFQEKPDEKILIISQWTSCLSLVSEYLNEKGIAHVKYQGDMNRSQRSDAVKIFMSEDLPKVMLLSLKCGGLGLNLTRANNVISLELGWSHAVEAQAFDRVHRLGQHRAVNIRRLVISGTVEERIIALQERKKALADGSLGEGGGKKIAKLTIGELANLFGLDVRGKRLMNASSCSFQSPEINP